MAKDSQKQLTRDLAKPVGIPQAGIDRALQVMRSGQLFRYGEFSGRESEVALLEREFALYMSADYAAAVNSCGSAMFIALKSAGVTAGDRVLVNAFTLAPVPGAIEHAGATPLLVDCDENYRICLRDLEEKAASGAKFFLMSHMRGHIADMDAVSRICAENNVILIEDCAHTLGASWDGRLSGSFGRVACFSLQSFKHVNAGEGGILTTNDEDIAAQAILYSGSYMLYAQNGARPALEVFEKYRYQIPNFSLRMHELTAAVARPQIALLAERAARWREKHDQLAALLQQIPGVAVPGRDTREAFVPSSIQFSLDALTKASIPVFLERCRARGLPLKWFGAHEPSGFTSTADHWRYIDVNQSVEKTISILSRLIDMRIPQELTTADSATIAAIISQSIAETVAELA